MLAQMLVIPLFRVETTVPENLAIGTILTVVSRVCRFVVLRRAFEATCGG